MNLLKYLNPSYLSSGSTRTVVVKRNIFFSFIIKGLNVLINLLIVPLSLDYLDVNTYGVWLTLSSIILWFSFFDIGLGNGLRNKLTEALTVRDYNRARIYVSTSYALISIISFIAAILFILINPLLDWNRILNTNELANLNLVVVIVFLLFFLRLTLQLLTSVLRADQKSAFSDLILLIINLFSLCCILLLNQAASRSLFWLAMALSLPPVIVLIVISFYLFSFKYKYITPSLKFINWKYSSELFSLGLRFFVIQIAALVLFTSSNVIITQLYGPEEVTIYNIAFKYFSIMTMLFNILLTPLWSAHTEAFVKDEFGWIKGITRKLLKFWMMSVIITAIMMAAANKFYEIWIGPGLQIPLLLTVITGLFVIITNWNLIFVSFLNGAGKIRLQLYSSILVLLINVPLSIYLASGLGLRSSGVILATCICQLIGAIWAPVQYYKVINQSAKGIWAK